MFNLRATTSFFVFDPVRPDTIYANGLGLWRSTDGGRTWSLVYPNPDAVSGIKIAGDHGEESIAVSGPGFVAISALAIDPADSGVLYAAAGRLFQVSTDWGATPVLARSCPVRPGRCAVDDREGTRPPCAGWLRPLHRRNSTTTLYLAHYPNGNSLLTVSNPLKLTHYPNFGSWIRSSRTAIKTSVSARIEAAADRSLGWSRSRTAGCPGRWPANRIARD